jgi:hypothetical protein
MTMEAIREGWW